MSANKYLDYEHLKYYHQKLKLKFDDFYMTNNDIEDVFDDIFVGTPKTLVDKTMNIPNNTGYHFRIRFGGLYNGESGNFVRIPVEWEQKNLTISSNIEYIYPDAINLQNYFYAEDAYGIDTPLDGSNAFNGLSIELVYLDENNNLQYYSTIGKIPSDSSVYSNDFLQSQYKSWDGIDFDDRDAWNFVDLDISLNSSKTYYLNYHTDSSNYRPNYSYPVTNVTAGSFIDSDEFQVTLIHNAPETYSVIFYWNCVV